MVYQQRRLTLLNQVKPDSVVLFAANHIVYRNNDANFPFRQHSDFWYLSGFQEPDAWLLLSNKQGKQEAVMFCLPSNKLAEIWHGRRLGVDNVVAELAVDAAHDVANLQEKLVDYLDGAEHVYFSLGENKANDECVMSVLEVLRSAPKQSKLAPTSLCDPRPLLHEMRLIKDEHELSLMRRAAQISVQGHKRAMRFSRPGIYEYQLEAEIHHEFLMSGARSPAYGSIVGAGDNACILHYTENSAIIQDNALVLIDAGAEYQGYAGDITRTFPANGQFTPEQKQIYQLVLDAQLAALEWYRPGFTLQQASDKAIEVITDGLIELGILSGTREENIQVNAHREYYMHGLGHYLGMDVHDVGDYKKDGQDRAFAAGMVLTIEPGIYIAPDADVDPKWHGIGVRIEDNVLITSDGYEVLTAELVKEPDAIEQFMQGSTQ